MKILRFNQRTFLIATLVALPLFISCKDKETPAENVPMTTQEATLEQKKQALENASPGTNTTNASGDLTLNPAHGQPGHQCGIPVGAPLNGSTGTTNNTSVQTIDMSQTKTIPAPTSGGAGMNPAHGQPGHRCDIKVGDPL
jgi:hypothetical protein